jgi:DNA polymerase III psi subunit
MSEPLDLHTREELFHLYSELQARCARAASALKLSLQWDTTGGELLARFYQEEAAAEAIWQQIQRLQKDP